MDHDIEWLDDNHLRIGDARFDLFSAEGVDDRPRPGVFLLEKSREIVEFYRERFGTDSGCTMFEIGIRWGASVALFHRLLNPKKLVTIDISEDSPPGLAEYIHANRAEECLRPHFGIDQADAAALRRLLAEELGDGPLDLVVDDGCHWLAESRSAFNTLFPRLRPGGAYVLEDWGWAHWPAFWQQHGGPWPDRGSLTQLVLEFVMTAASRADVVRSVEVHPALVLVRRGSARLDDAFNISRCYLTAGRRFVELGPPKTSLGRLRVRLIRRIHQAIDLTHARGVRALLAKVARLAHSGQARGPHASRPGPDT